MSREYGRILSTLIALSLVFMLALTGCGGNKEAEENKQPVADPKPTVEEKIVVYTTLYPIYDFVGQIGGEFVTVKSIVPPGAESHDFEPSPKDMTEINESNLFIYNGAGFETWIEKITENLDTSKTMVVVATEGIELLEADEHGKGEHDEHGKEKHDEHKDDHGKEEHDDHGSLDPHVWLDPIRAKQQAHHVFKALSAIDPEHIDTYQSNFEKLIADIDALDAAYNEAVAKAKNKEFVVAHAAFGYLANRYGLEQIPVSGISPSAEPSQKELQELIEIVKKHNIKYVAFDELVESKVAQTVQRETGAEAVTLSNLENATKEQFAAGKTYVDLMMENLETLKKVLEVQ
jgi:zinc transport system substrate-binding protein